MDSMKSKNEMLELEVKHLKEQLTQKENELVGEEEYKDSIRLVMEEVRTKKRENKRLWK